MPKVAELLRTRLCSGRLTLLVATLLLLVLIALVLTLVLFPRGPLRFSGPKVCRSTQCQDRSKLLERMIDRSASACQDFYQFACGQWIANATLPPDQSVIDPFSQLSDQIRASLNASLLRRADRSDKPGHAVNKAAYFVRRCEEFDTKEPEGVRFRQLKATLDRIAQAPLFSAAWNETSFAKEQFVGRLLGVTLDNFLLIDVLPDEKNSSLARISIYQPTMFIQRSYLINTSSASFQAYSKFATAVLTDLCRTFAPDQSHLVAAQVGEMLEFERRLAAITMDSADTVEYTKLLTLRRFDSLDSTLRNILNAFVKNRVKQGIEDSENIQFMLGTRFTTNFVQLLSQTPGRVVANFGIWTAIRGVLFETLPASVRAHHKAFWLVDQGSMPNPRWKTCLDLADIYYKMAVGRIYVDEHFDKRIKHQVTEMVGYVKDAFLRHSILENDWLDEETRQAAAEKLAALRLAIGYPDYILNDTALNALYQNFPDESNSFADLVLQCALARSNSLIDSWSSTLVDRLLWVMSPHQVQAYYDHNRNMVAMLAAILSSPPFYQSDIPQALNFGAIGWVIGHEISHGYDTNGQAYDKDGNLRDWWKSNKTAQSFETRGQCIVEHFSRMCFPDLPPPTQCVNGNLTKAENIADFGGLPTAYRAYQAWKAAKGPDSKLIGHEHYSDEQLFFLGAASMWCERNTQQYLTLLLLNDAHSPGKFRVNGVLWGMPEFARAFNCPLGSAMNPNNAKRCKVW